MSLMSDESVDLIVTDPPYRNISGGTPADSRRPTGILDKNDGKIFAHNDLDVSEWAADMYRVVRSPGHCYVMCNVLNLWRFHEVLTGVGFLVHNLLIWKKNTTNPNRWYMKNAEYILFLRKGPARAINTPSAQTCQEARNVTGRDRRHPTEKPVELMRTFIEASSQPGDMVFDPFMGAGGTGVAALGAGRRFIGFEIDPEHFETARCRLIGKGTNATFAS